MSPDGLFGVRFNHGCYLHDRQYRNEVKVRKTRKQTDKDFRDKIYSIYKSSKAPFRFDVLGYLRVFLKKDQSLMKLVTFKSSNKYLLLFRNHILGWFVSRAYYYAVRTFGSRVWIK